MNEIIYDRELPAIRSIESPLIVNGTRLQGYAIVYGVKTAGPVNYMGQYAFEVIEKGAFDDSIASRNIPFIWEHKGVAQFGDTATGTLTLTPDDYGVKVDLQVPEYATALRSEVEKGLIRGYSFGMPKGAVYEMRDGIRHIKKATLDHVAAVYHPAYLDATVSMKKPKTTGLKKKELQLKEKM